MNTELCIEIVKGTFTLAAALLTVWLGLKFYFRQKEYELVKQRYLDGAVDIVASEIERSLGVHSHNWARCLNIVRAYRDQEGALDLEELGKGFIEYESANFQTIAHHRLQILTNNKVYWEVCQLALAFATNSDSIMRREIPDAIKARLTTDSNSTPHAEIVEACFLHLKSINEDSHKYAVLGRELQLLSTLLERGRMSFKELNEFRSQEEVKQSIKNLESTYAEKLTAYRE